MTPGRFATLPAFVAAALLMLAATGCHHDSPAAPDRSILSAGPLRLGEPVARAIADLGHGTETTYGARGGELRAIEWEDASGALGIVVRDGLVAAIEAQQNYDKDPIHLYGFGLDDTASVRKPRIGIADMRWLGLPLFSKTMRAAPRGWTTDIKPDRSPPIGVNVVYQSAQDPSLIFWYENSKFGIQSFIVTTFPER